MNGKVAPVTGGGGRIGWAIAGEHGMADEAAKRPRRQEREVRRFGTPADEADRIVIVPADRDSYTHGRSYILDSGFTEGL